MQTQDNLNLKSIRIPKIESSTSQCSLAPIIISRLSTPHLNPKGTPHFTAIASANIFIASRRKVYLLKRVSRAGGPSNLGTR